MRERKRTVVCPKCRKKFSPQGLNGHMRFVHGVGAEEAAKATASAPRADQDESSVAKLEARIDSLEESLEETADALAPMVKEYQSRSSDRRRLVALVAELADVKKQMSPDFFDWSGGDKQVMASLQQAEADIRRDIAALSAKLGESES